MINHHAFNRLLDLEGVDKFQNLFDRIMTIYGTDFRDTTLTDLYTYENTGTHPMKYLRVSYRLLQEPSLHKD